MSRFLALVALLFLLPAYAQRNLAVTPDAAGPQRRVALVIGNGAYPGAPLRNPVNDARDVAAALKGLGFDVTERFNANQKDMNRAIALFGGRIDRNAVAVFYYAGHGMQVQGKNFLLPVDAQITNEGSVRAEAVDVDAVLDQFAASTLNIVILDACRNNPFERRFRSAGGGLAQMDAPKGTLIAYATAPGKVAADGDGRNGLYTQELLKALREPGLPVEQMFKRVRAQVTRLSADAQTPWESSSLMGDFFFKPGAASAGQAMLAPPPSSRPAAAPDPVEAAYWSEVTRSGDQDSYASYLVAYPDGPHAAEAMAWLERDRRDKADKARAKEDQAWSETLATNTHAAYGVYLKAYPGGRYLALARLKQKNLSPAIAPGRPFRDCDSCPEMMLIPAGSFDMGSPSGDWDRKDNEGPAHPVSLPAFALARTEVTQGMWRELMGSLPSSFKNCGDDCPVERVNWDDAQEFLRRLSAMAGKEYRLPSEAEWEYACRAGKKHRYCGSDDAGAVGWYGGNGATLRAVGLKAANAWGLHDMSGNVLEWVQDCWHASYNGAPADGSAWVARECSKRVQRGGDWASVTSGLRAAWREGVSPDSRHIDLGFRPARSLP